MSRLSGRLGREFPTAEDSLAHFVTHCRKGIPRALSGRESGYPQLDHVPYGRQWYAYFMRRLAERPANLLFLLRNLFRA